MLVARSFVVILLGLVVTVVVPPPSYAGSRVEYTIEIKDHKFVPEVIKIPAGIKSKLIVINRDATPEEFESLSLNREKIVHGNGKIKVFLPPLKVGEYDFFGDFHPETVQGKIIVK